MSRIEDIMYKAYKLGIQDVVLIKVTESVNRHRTVDLNAAYENAFEQAKKEFSYDDTNKSTIQSS